MTNAHRLLVFLAAPAILAACSQEAPPSVPSRPVATVLVRANSADLEKSYSGIVRAQYETPLSFRIGGKLVRRLVEVGDQVRPGQTLATLDAVDATLQADQAQAQLDMTITELRRNQQLRTDNAVSQAQLDVSETAYKIALSKAKLAHNVQSYSSLASDSPGVVAAIMAETGQIISPGSPVMVVARSGGREVSLFVSESDIDQHKIGDAATIELWAHPKRRFSGAIREIGPYADIVTRAYPIRVAITDADATVELGMTARIAFKIQQSSSLLVPSSAIFQKGTEPAVWVVGNNNIADLRKVTVSGWQDDSAVISAGLTAGERIIAFGVHKVNAGESVKAVAVSQ